MKFQFLLFVPQTVCADQHTLDGSGGCFLARQIRKICRYSVDRTYSTVGYNGVSVATLDPTPRVFLFKAKLTKLSSMLLKITLLLPERSIPSLSNRPLSSKNILFSGQQMGASMPLNSASPATSICHFLLWHPLPAAGIVSPHRPCSWLSTAVKASYLVLVAVLEGGE